MIYGREFSLSISYTKYSFVYNVLQLTRTMCSYSIHNHIRNRCLFDSSGMQLRISVGNSSDHECGSSEIYI